MLIIALLNKCNHLKVIIMQDNKLKLKTINRSGLNLILFVSNMLLYFYDQDIKNSANIKMALK